MPQHLSAQAQSPLGREAAKNMEATSEVFVVPVGFRPKIRESANRPFRAPRTKVRDSRQFHEFSRNSARPKPGNAIAQRRAQPLCDATPENPVVPRAPTT